MLTRSSPAWTSMVGARPLPRAGCLMIFVLLMSICKDLIHEKRIFLIESISHQSCLPRLARLVMFFRVHRVHRGGRREMRGQKNVCMELETLIEVLAKVKTGVSLCNQRFLCSDDSCFDIKRFIEQSQFT